MSNTINVFIQPFNVEVKYSYFKFSAGELQVKIENHEEVAAIFKTNLDAPYSINFYTNTLLPEEFFLLAMLKNALEEILWSNKEGVTSDVTSNIYLSYMPYSRQDRVCSPGEASGLLQFLVMLESLDFDSITTLDLHNTDLPFLANIRSVPPSILVHSFPELRNIILENRSEMVVVAPDNGSLTRAHGFASEFKLPVVEFEKVRDTSDGRIIGYQPVDRKEAEEELKGKIVLVVDDICDGGATFNKLGEQIYHFGVQKAYLYVTHGIFAKGLNTLANYYENVYTYNFIGKQENIDIENFLVIRGGSNV